MNKYTVAHIKSFYTDEKKKTDSKLPFFHRKIVRPISFYLTIPFLYLGFSANQVTFLSLIFAIAGNIGFALGTFDSMRLGAVLIIVAIELDFVDGNIARYHTKTSQYGSFIDGSFGVLMYAFMPFCIGIGISQNELFLDPFVFSGEISIAIGAFLSIIYLFNNYIQWRYKAQLAVFNKIEKLNIENHDQMEKIRRPINYFSKIFINILNTFNNNIFIPSLILLFFKMPNILLCVFAFTLLSSSFIIILRIYRNALNNLS